MLYLTKLNKGLYIYYKFWTVCSAWW